MYLMKDLFEEYIKNSKNLIIRKEILNGRKYEQTLPQKSHADCK